MNKDIHKAIMNRLAYKKQRNDCVSSMRENKEQYYCSLNVNRIPIIKTSGG